MISSKELLDKTGISRATLNNYINKGLIARPSVHRPDMDISTAKQMGFFPELTAERIRDIQRLKKEGYSMDEIAQKLAGSGAAVAKPEAPTEASPVAPPVAPEARRNSENSKSGFLHLTLDEIPHPAYMVNYSLEVAWLNELARDRIFPQLEAMPANNADRSVFLLLQQAWASASAEDREEIVRLHVALAKPRTSRASLTQNCRAISGDLANLVDRLYEATPAAPNRGIYQHVIAMPDGAGKRSLWNVHASFFREGVLLVFVPEGETSSTLLDFLSRRDLVIRNLLRERLPVLTPLAVMVADLQNSVTICSELPPEEYFELINQIWSTMGPIFRRYYGTHGKHVGDGMVYYFFPQPDSQYASNAIQCAREVQRAMQRISKDWQIRKNWLNDLYLNTGLHEGQEWLGTFQTETSVEFAVLGETINQAARLSDFARRGEIWATKGLISKLAPDDRKAVEFGIPRYYEDGTERFVRESYALISSLVDLGLEKNEKLRDISMLAVTQVRAKNE
jgi:class 3 adenylate cyclase/DNA-binding transcriptional MerR regulator